MIGNVQAGSLFAACQSLGAGGKALTALTGYVQLSGMAMVAVGGLGSLTEGICGFGERYGGDRGREAVSLSPQCVIFGSMLAYANKGEKDSPFSHFLFRRHAGSYNSMFGQDAGSSVIILGSGE